MMETILTYIRSWFPASPINDLTRKRKASDTFYHLTSPKHRRTLSPMLNIDDEFMGLSLRSPARRPLNSNLQTVVIDDDDDIRPISKPIDIKGARERKLVNGDDSFASFKSVRSFTEKKLDADKAGYTYITRFSSDHKSPLRRLPMQNGTKSHRKTSSISKTPKDNKMRTSLRRSFVSSPSLDYSVRLDDKKRYQELLDNMELQTSFNSSSFYGTPVGTLFNDRSSRLVQLARSPKLKPIEVVDLTQPSETKLSTKDTVIKVLDDFESVPVEDSDSDVEILPTPPSPKPDIKVDPVNSLKTVIDTSKATHQKWLNDITKKHERYVEEKSKEIQAYSENSLTLEEINRDLLFKNLSRKVQESLAIQETILPIIEDEEEVELPALSDEQLKMVKRALSGDPNEILTKKFNLNVNRRDIQTLAGLNWLNDNVINFYMNLIIERGNDSKFPKVYAMNTFFYQKLSTSGPESLRRWTRKVDIFSHKFICVPIHLGMHWCMAIINLKEKTIKYYDSMGHSNNQCLNALKNYLEYEHMDKKNQPFSTKDFVLENVRDIPQQMNGSDCGMFSCTFAEFATRKAKFSFQQEDMPYLRKKMVVEILTGHLLIQ